MRIRERPRKAVRRAGRKAVKITLRRAARPKRRTSPFGGRRRGTLVAGFTAGAAGGYLLGASQATTRGRGVA